MYFAGALLVFLAAFGMGATASLVLRWQHENDLVPDLPHRVGEEHHAGVQEKTCLGSALCLHECSQADGDCYRRFRRRPLARTRVNEEKKKGRLSLQDFTREVGLLAHHQQQIAPPGGSLRSRRHASLQLQVGFGSELRCPRDTPAASSHLRYRHRAPAYLPQLLPRPSRCVWGL